MTTTVTEVWRQIHDGLRGFIAKRVADPAEVDDILQEVFLRIHQRINGLKDPHRVLSWVYQITRHAIIDHYRTPNHRREVPAGSAADMEAIGLTITGGSGEGDEDSGQFRTELAGCLRPMLSRLSQDYREAIAGGTGGAHTTGCGGTSRAVPVRNEVQGAARPEATQADFVRLLSDSIGSTRRSGRL